MMSMFTRRGLIASSKDEVRLDSDRGKGWIAFNSLRMLELLHLSAALSLISAVTTVQSLGS
jgi:hypothetical protein